MIIVENKSTENKRPVVASNIIKLTINALRSFTNMILFTTQNSLIELFKNGINVITTIDKSININPCCFASKSDT